MVIAQNWNLTFNNPVKNSIICQSIHDVQLLGGRPKNYIVDGDCSADAKTQSKNSNTHI